MATLEFWCEDGSESLVCKVTDLCRSEEYCFLFLCVSESNMWSSTEWFFSSLPNQAGHLVCYSISAGTWLNKTGFCENQWTESIFFSPDFVWKQWIEFQSFSVGYVPSFSQRNAFYFSDFGCLKPLRGPPTLWFFSCLPNQAGQFVFHINAIMQGPDWIRVDFVRKRGDWIQFV
jgi:hypothetical protein